MSATGQMHLQLMPTPLTVMIGPYAVGGIGNYTAARSVVSEFFTE